MTTTRTVTVGFDDSEITAEVRTTAEDITLYLVLDGITAPAIDLTDPDNRDGVDQLQEILTYALIQGRGYRGSSQTAQERLSGLKPGARGEKPEPLRGDGFMIETVPDP